MEQATKEIIQKIAEIQIEALTSINRNPNKVNHELLKKYLQIEDDEICIAARKLKTIYKQLKEKPETINLLNEYQLYICSHILFRMEDEWIQGNQFGVKGAWVVIMDASEKFHQELNLLI